jgi:anti-sigma B factor antagonist
MDEVQRLKLTIRTVKPRDGVTVVALAGECDLYEAPRLEAALEEAGASPEDRVYVDLSELRFLDSTGLHALLEAQRALAERRADLVLVAPAAEIRRTLTVAGLDGRFEVRERLDADTEGDGETSPVRSENGSTDSVFRSVNERILEISATWEGQELHLFCECDDEKCTRPIAVEREAYERVRETPQRLILHPEHVLGGDSHVVEARDGYVVVSTRLPSSGQGKEAARV